MLITPNQLKEKHRIIGSLLTKDELNPESQSTLKYAIRMWDKSAQDFYNGVQKQYDKINLKYAEKKTGSNVLMVDESGRYCYTEMNEILRKEAIEEVDHTEYEFTPHLFDESGRIETFGLFEKQELKGIFLP